MAMRIVSIKPFSININLWLGRIIRLGLQLKIEFLFLPQKGKLGPFDRLDMVSCVNKQHKNDSLRGLQTNNENMFELLNVISYKV